MQPCDVVRIWNENQRRYQRRNVKAVLVMVGCFLGIALLAWWVKV